MEERLKVGDRVKTPCHGLGTIIGYTDNGFEPWLVEHDNWNDGHNGCDVEGFSGTMRNRWWYWEPELQLMTKPTFKVGDKVRVTGDKGRFGHGFEDGTVGQIVVAASPVFGVKGDTGRWWVHEKDLERLQPPQFAQAQPAWVETLDERDDAHLRPAMWPNGSSLPAEPAQRKAVPITTGVLDYFPAALAEVARVSKAGNEQHHPGQPLHWERGKSTDHADTITRHLMDRGTLDIDGQRHSAKVAWRALALLQEELEAEGAPKARGSR